MRLPRSLAQRRRSRRSPQADPPCEAAAPLRISVHASVRRALSPCPPSIPFPIASQRLPPSIRAQPQASTDLGEVGAPQGRRVGATAERADSPAVVERSARDGQAKSRPKRSTRLKAGASGEGGIRTRGRLLTYARLASGYLRPLGHLSGFRWDGRRQSSRVRRAVKRRERQSGGNRASRPGSLRFCGLRGLILGRARSPGPVGVCEAHGDALLARREAAPFGFGERAELRA